MKIIAIIIMLIIAAGCTGILDGLNPEKYPVIEGKNLTVVFFDVGQGDSSLILTPEGKTILIDCGEHEDAAEYLEIMNITKIDALLVTHEHRDHYGGCSYVKEAVDVGIELTNENVKNDFELGITNYTFIEIITAYDTHGKFSDENDNSVSLRAVYGEVSFLFTGDCSTQCEKEMAKTQNIRADVLQVGHHGSKHSTTEQFLEKVNPSSAVISCGAGNQYGHPDEETLGKLSDNGIVVYRTDIHGNIAMTTDGRAYSAIR